jgi:hypothetical protein
VTEENNCRPSRSATRTTAEIVEVAVAQRIGQRQHLQPAGHPLHFGIEHQADAAHRFQHPLGRVLAVLLVILKNDANREDDQRQRGPSDQES